MQIFVRSLRGEWLTLNVAADDLVGDVRKQLCHTEEIHVERYGLQVGHWVQGGSL